MKRRLLGPTLLFAVLALAGCSSGTSECDDTSDCTSPGDVCVHEHAHDVDADTCEYPCTDSSQCRQGESCTCPDSPSGQACKTDDGGFTKYCFGRLN
ncbi:hypothetical protein [Corallococcus llansteffanensis]|uniref:EGF-like domain-containing protein n=1 Tax=Corallococcus llansteffanensis TaxID=2316731 RepID=A0A3A8QQZ0_9BACT|nr:hypothetical protein [Corallococcus llansteffanensis]RKH67292.1 hypothetical protein D7V93_03215 [Corallococcus llansteffanensis]